MEQDKRKAKFMQLKRPVHKKRAVDQDNPLQSFYLELFYFFAVW